MEEEAAVDAVAAPAEDRVVAEVALTAAARER